MEKSRSRPHTRPVLYVIAGPNGSGKTTFARKYLPLYANCFEFINADLIASGMSPFSPDKVAIQAGRIMLKRFDELSRRNLSFAFETTMAGTLWFKRLKACKLRGYQIHLFFLWIENVDLALERIADRVRNGGHNVPEDVVRRRFERGLKNFLDLYRPIADLWSMWDNSFEDPILISYGDKGNTHILMEDLYDTVIHRGRTS